MPIETIQALMTRLVDYTGLFPPANLGMRAAVTEYARHQRSDDAWMLGRFIVPTGRLDELQAAVRDFLPRGRSQRPWTFSALVADRFEASRERIDAFNRAHNGRAAVQTVEIKPSDAEEIARAARAFEGLKIFYELSARHDPGPLMAAVATLGGRAKVRTGGPTADAVPAAADLVRFVAAARRSGIAFKATAGLHHPLPGEYRLNDAKNGPTGALHGFLNFVLAAAWLQHEILGDAEAQDLLAESDPEALAFAADEVRWRDFRLGRDQLAATRRQFVLSFGSCSFSEPVKALRSLKLL